MRSWLTRLSEPGTTARLGPLERRVLEALWTRPSATARDLYPLFADIAPTTLTTTLDRLAQKGVLERARNGRAHVYRSQISRQEFETAHAASAIRAALTATPTSEGCRTLLSTFVHEIGTRDPELLDRLEAMIQTRRAALPREHS